jgi:hypothetical protein
MRIKRLLAASLFALVSAGAVVGLISSQSAEALPSKEVYHIYYYDEARTQYAGEELLLACRGAIHQMIDGVRTPYYRKTSENCDTGSWASTCFRCSSAVNGFPTLPVCYTGSAVNCNSR